MQIEVGPLQLRHFADVEHDGMVVEIAAGEDDLADVLREDGQLVLRWYIDVGKAVTIPLDLAIEALRRAGQEVDSPSA